MTINIKSQANYWRRNASQKWKTAKSLWQSKRYADCLFFCHLTLECLLKGLVVIRTKNIPPYIHDLLILADRASLVLTEELKDKIEKITTFNLTNRYPDEKFKFYKMIDKEYCKNWLKISNQIRLWLTKKY